MDARRDEQERAYEEQVGRLNEQARIDDARRRAGADAEANALEAEKKNCAALEDAVEIVEVASLSIVGCAEIRPLPRKH